MARESVKKIDRLIDRIVVTVTTAFKAEYMRECDRAGVEMSSIVRPAIEASLATVKALPDAAAKK